jgi:hypothetical protein
MRVHVKHAGRVALVLTLLLTMVLVSTAVMAQSPADGPAPQPNPNAIAPDQREAEIQAVARAAGTAFKVLPPAAFSSDGDNPGGFFTDFARGYVVGKVGVCLAAPLDLPAGVTITGFEVRMNDANTMASAFVALHRIDLEATTRTAVAEVSSPMASTGGTVWLVDDTIVDPVVSDMAAYQVVMCLGPEIYLYGVRVGYEARTVLPLVVK